MRIWAITTTLSTQLKKRLKDAARKLLALGVDADTIAKATELAPDVIKSLGV